MSETALSFTPEAILNRLRGDGLRITPGRRVILEVLFEAGKPLSLEEIKDLAAARGSRPDYATVFRLMTLLERLHLAHKVNLQRSCSYYELHDPKKHYDHIVCTSCGKARHTGPHSAGSVMTWMARGRALRIWRGSVMRSK